MNREEFVKDTQHTYTHTCITHKYTQTHIYSGYLRILFSCKKTSTMVLLLIFLLDLLNFTAYYQTTDNWFVVYNTTTLMYQA